MGPYKYKLNRKLNTLSASTFFFLRLRVTFFLSSFLIFSSTFIFSPAYATTSGQAIHAPNTCASALIPSVATYFNQYVDYLRTNISPNMDAGTKDKVRMYAFFIEGLARLFEDVKPKKSAQAFTQIRALSKSIEDRLGANGLKRDLLNACEESSGADSGRCSRLRAEYQEDEESLHLFLEENGWLQTPTSNAQPRPRPGKNSLGGLATLQTLLDSIKWSSPKKTKKYILKALLREYKKFNRDLADLSQYLLKKDKFSFQFLEEHLHELRRKLRWICIQILALPGHFTLSEIPPDATAEEEKLIADFKDNKYANVSSSTPGAIVVPRVAYYYLVQFIEKLGNIKDFGETHYYLSRTINDSPQTSSWDEDAFMAEVHAIVRDLLDHNPIPEFIQLLTQEKNGE